VEALRPPPTPPTPRVATPEKAASPSVSPRAKPGELPGTPGLSPA
jgi:hypothetical protein